MFKFSIVRQCFIRNRSPVSKQFSFFTKYKSNNINVDRVVLFSTNSILNRRHFHSQRHRQFKLAFSTSSKFSEQQFQTQTVEEIETLFFNAKSQAKLQTNYIEVLERIELFLFGNENSVHHQTKITKANLLRIIEMLKLFITGK